MVLYLNLVLAHILGDFVLQPGRLVAAKRRHVLGLVGHGGVIGACTALVLVSDLPEMWHALAYVTAAHLLIEILTIRARRLWGVRGLFVLALDQALHLASLVVPVAITGGWAANLHLATFGLSIAPERLAAVVAMMAAVFLGSILVVEAADAADPSGEECIVPFDVARVLGMLERGASLGIALVGGPALLAVPFLPRALRALRLPPVRRAREAAIAVSGLLLCIVAYGFAAGIAAAAAAGGR